MLAALAVSGQTGGPPNRPMPGPGIPFPKRGSKQAKNAEDPQQLDSLKGALRAMSETEIIVEADDKRLLTITRTTKTKFLVLEEPVKAETIQPGERLMIDASQDDKGRWTAVEVRMMKRGTPEERARARVPVPAAEPTEPSEQAEGGATPAAPAAEPVERPSTEMAPVAPKDSAGGQGERPKLARGGRVPAPQRVATVEQDEPEPKPEPRAAPSSARDRESRDARADSRRDDAPPSAESNARDEFIEKAREAAENFAESLPSYTVKQFTTRFQSDNPRVNWQPLDNISAEVIYDKGKENYRNILINGKAPKTKVEDTGSWSTGEFGTVLRDIFSPASAADFRPSGSATIVNRSAKLYKFVVDQENSHWRIVAPGQFYFPSYKGTIWVDKETSRVLRIEMQTRNVPKDFPFDTVESTLEYDFIRLGASNAYLLPVHAENLICQRGTSTCSKNIIDFRNYRKFGAESTIIFK